MAQLMPLPLTVSCFSKIQISFAFLVPAHPGSPGKGPLTSVCVCVCVCGNRECKIKDTKLTQNKNNEYHYRNIITIINFICQHKHKQIATDCNTTKYNMVKYAEQDRDAQQRSYLGPKRNRN